MVLAEDPLNSSLSKTNNAKRYSVNSEFTESSNDTNNNNNNNNRSNDNNNNNNNNNRRKGRKQKYQRKRIPETERERKRIYKERQQQYERLIQRAEGTTPSIWSFDNLFPKPVIDEQMIDQDLYGVSRRDQKIRQQKMSLSSNDDTSTFPKLKTKISAIDASTMMRSWKEPEVSSPQQTQYSDDNSSSNSNSNINININININSSNMESTSSTSKEITDEEAQAQIFASTYPTSETSNSNTTTTAAAAAAAIVSEQPTSTTENNTSGKVDVTLTRMVEDRIFGYRSGTNLYETSLIGDGAIQFREGIRLGNPLRVNADRLNYHAKKELRSNRLEEAQELYEQAIQIDPRDGRAYIGLSRCAQRRRDFKLAKEYLRIGIAQSVSCGYDSTPDVGANPFLLQTLGCLEEKMGHLSEAESLYISAVRSRPSHAASWVALAQIRTRKFRQGAAAGRVCFQAAERELEKVGMPPSSYVYTAWASLEYKKCGDVRRARKLFKAALMVDKKCSAAWLQLGMLEADLEHWDQAELCFETVLKFDQRNSRVIQAYAIMESKRPYSNSRKVIDLFERALKANSRDAGVLQPYGLYVAKLGDIDSARDLLRRATEVNKRHAPAWQAWGVMETREGYPEEARNIFQQGIWACAQLTGGQSGGYKCARLWQGWGVLEASEGDFAAARRCFSRALDADNRNLAAITAWTHMEEGLDNLSEARQLFKQSLEKFTPGTDETKQLWRAYELMEQRSGNEANAQEVYRQSMRESFSVATADQGDSSFSNYSPSVVRTKNEEKQPQSKDDPDGKNRTPKKKREFEVSRWDQGGSSSMKAEMMLDGSIEGKVPRSAMNKKKKKPTSSSSSSSTTTTTTTPPSEPE
jgi:tetratricopeptide (TPR) repeat protein